MGERKGNSVDKAKYNRIGIIVELCLLKNNF